MRPYKFRRFYLFVLLILVSSVGIGQSKRPAIGLALSGGGAKGLAHIGILKALDSAGLRIDYVTGTSMGSIVGAMYAAGYSVDSIESIARQIDWDLLLTNQSLLRSYIMEEKAEYDRYAIELPLVRGKVKLASGLLEAEELWLKLSEIFYSTLNIHQFKDLPIPFACIATDLSTGEAVVLDSGNLVTAIRSSMAIPSVFTAVKRNGKTLVDGGIVRNLPISDLRNMGATFVIGSDVGSPLKPADSLNSPIDVMLQVAFFREAALKPAEDSLCNLLIKQNVDQYGAGGFASSDAIIDLGIEAGRQYYPIFKQMADSLQKLYGVTKKQRSSQVKIPSTISSIQVNGLVHTDEEFFVKLIGLRVGDTASEALLSRKIRNAFGTRYYNKILYRFETYPPDQLQLVFDVTENPLTAAKVGLHFNKATGINAILNLTTRNWLFPKSRDLITVNIGDNFKMRAEHMQLLGEGAGKFAWFLQAGVENQELNNVQDQEKSGLYNQRYTYVGSKIQLSRKRSRSFGVGFRQEWISFNPQIPGNNMIDGSNKNFYLLGYGQHNTLDKGILPEKGMLMSYELGWVLGQSPQGSIQLSNGTSTNLNEMGLSYGNHQRLFFQFDSYKTIHKKNTFIHSVQAGLLFNNQQILFHDFMIGGLNHIFRNQVLFAGLEEANLVTPSFISYGFSWRKKWTANLYSTWRTNILGYDFLLTKNEWASPAFRIGHAATAGYKSPIGPLEFSVMYDHTNRKLLTYINLGLAF